MKLLNNRESGQVMILVLLLLAAGSLLVVPMLKVTATSNVYHNIADSRTWEAYSADAGVQYAMHRLLDDPNTHDFTHNFTLNDRAVNVTAEGMGNNVVNITATATSSSGGSTSLTSSSALLLSIFQEYAVADMGGGTDIKNSYFNSNPDTDEADIHSNGNIYLDENSRVDGWITYLGSLTGDGDYLGATQVEVAEVYPPVEPVDLDFWKAQALLGGTHNGDLHLDDREGYDLGPLYINGRLTIEDESEIDLRGVVYVEDEIKILGESEIMARGPLDGALISANGYVEIKNSRVGQSGRLVLIVVPNGEVEFINDDEGGSLNALIYAPTAKVTLKGSAGETARFRGSVVANLIYIEDVDFTYITSFVDPEHLYGGEYNIISYSYGP